MHGPNVMSPSVAAVLLVIAWRNFRARHSASVPRVFGKVEGMGRWQSSCCRAFITYIDHDLREPDLPGPSPAAGTARRLAVQGGNPGRELTITSGLASIVQDDLANMYQGCVEGVSNFDPWD